MSAAEGDRFGLGQGRPRPAYTPKSLHCPHCGAGLTVKDEHSEMVVCDYCGSHLEVTSEELTVLGKGPARKWDFPLALGASFRHKGARYEVIARLALIEDGDPTYLTREYLLYNPYRGTLWLSEYQGHYDLSSTTHVMPVGEPFSCGKGDSLETHDGRQWVMEETGEYELAYVDGALPWVAKVGDRQRYAELTAEDGSGDLYEAEAQGQELEYGIGRRVPLAMVRRATGKEDLPEPAAPLENVARTRSAYHWMLKLTALALAVNAVLWLLAGAKGHEVLEQRFDAAALTRETLSQPFEIRRADDVVKVELDSRALDNAWMVVDVAVVEGEDRVIHTLEADMEYYHGYEGGESWSEGSRSRSVYFRVPEAGTHRLLLHAVSATGETPQAEAAQHPLRVRVVAGAVRPLWFKGVTVLCLVSLVGVGMSYLKWKKGEED